MLSAFDHPRQRIEHFKEGDLVTFLRRRKKSGSYECGLDVRTGPNHVHAAVIHADGDIENLGISTNLLTNIGRDVWSGTWGFIGAGVTTASPATATSATSVTVTGSG